MTTPENLPVIYDPPLELQGINGDNFLVHSFGERHDEAEPDMEDAYYVMWRFVHGGFRVKRSHGKGAPEYHVDILDPEADDRRPLGKYADESPVLDNNRLIRGRYLGVNTVVEVQAYAKGRPLNDRAYRYLETKGRPDLTEKILKPEELEKHLPAFTVESLTVVAEQLSKDFGISPKVS